MIFDPLFFIPNEEVTLFAVSAHLAITRLLIYFFALTDIEPFNKLSNVDEINEIKLPFGNLPAVGYSISFPELENIENIDKSKVKEKTENLSWLVNKRGTQLELNFEDEDYE